MKASFSIALLKLGVNGSIIWKAGRIDSARDFRDGAMKRILLVDKTG